MCFKVYLVFINTFLIAFVLMLGHVESLRGPELSDNYKESFEITDPMVVLRNLLSTQLERLIEVNSIKQENAKPDADAVQYESQGSERKEVFVKPNAIDSKNEKIVATPHGKHAEIHTKRHRKRVAVNDYSDESASTSEEGLETSDLNRNSPRSRQSVSLVNSNISQGITRNNPPSASDDDVSDEDVVGNTDTNAQNNDTANNMQNGGSGGNEVNNPNVPTSDNGVNNQNVPRSGNGVNTPSTVTSGDEVTVNAAMTPDDDDAESVETEERTYNPWTDSFYDTFEDGSYVFGYSLPNGVTRYERSYYSEDIKSRITEGFYSQPRHSAYGNKHELRCYRADYYSGYQALKVRYLRRQPIVRRGEEPNVNCFRKAKTS